MVAVVLRLSLKVMDIDARSRNAYFCAGIIRVYALSHRDCSALVLVFIRRLTSPSSLSLERVRLPCAHSIRLDSI
jgi:hypothetical protein